jgi:hypothetical protein
VAVETERGSAANQARLGSCGDVLGHLMKPTHDSRASVRPAISSSAVAAYDRHNNEQVDVARQQELRTSLVRPQVRVSEKLLPALPTGREISSRWLYGTFSPSAPKQHA